MAPRSINSFAVLLWCSCLSLVLQLCEAKKAPAIGFYFDFVDCGKEEELLNFSVSVTPYPALIKSDHIMLWFGGTVHVTETAKYFAQNVPLDEFLQNARLTFTPDDSSDPSFGEYLSPFHDEPFCTLRISNDDSMMVVAAEFCEAIHAAMLVPGTKKLFIPLDAKSKSTILLLELSMILESLPPPPQLAKIQVKISYFNTTVMCLQWNLRTQHVAIGENNQFINAFSTPKIVDFANKSTCPLHSKEQSSDNGCQCSLPNRSGPQCIFQCNLEQIKPLHGCSSKNTPSNCSFTSFDYSIMCLREQTVTILNNTIFAIADSFSNVRIKWQLTNYFSFAPYIAKITIHNEDGQELGIFTPRLPYYEGIESESNVTLTCQKEDWRDCTDLLLQSFTRYKITLGVRSTGVVRNKSKGIIYIEAGTATFDSPEDIPQHPIIEVKIVDEMIHVNWYLSGQDFPIPAAKHCPGIIRRYDAKISCFRSASANTSYNHSESLPSPFNCKNITSFPHLIIIPLAEHCDGDSLYAQLRVATDRGYGNWSDTYSLPLSKRSWPTWLIVTVSLAGFFIASFVFIICFTYYYKTRIVNYIGAHKLIMRLLKRSLPNTPEQSTFTKTEAEYLDNGSGPYTEIATPTHNTNSPGTNSLAICAYEDSRFVNSQALPIFVSDSSSKGYVTYESIKL